MSHSDEKLPETDIKPQLIPEIVGKPIHWVLAEENWRQLPENARALLSELGCAPLRQIRWFGGDASYVMVGLWFRELHVNVYELADAMGARMAPISDETTRDVDGLLNLIYPNPNGASWETVRDWGKQYLFPRFYNEMSQLDRSRWRRLADYG